MLETICPNAHDPNRLVMRVEFYGVPRQRAGIDAVEVDGNTLGGVLLAAGAMLPGFAEACLAGGRLRPGYLASVNGDRFTTDPEWVLHAGDAVLILSADVGG